MSDEFSIFDSPAATDRGEFFAFKEKGDRVEGTYIDVRQAEDGFHNQQMIYVLMDRKNGGKIWNVGVKMWNVGVIETMKNTRFGQIVGFYHDGEKESKKSGRKFKDIKVATDARFFDKEWLEEQKKIEEAFAGMPKPSEQVVKKETPSSVDFDDFGETPSNAQPLKNGIVETDTGPVDHGTMPLDSVIAVRALAKSKGLVTDEMSDAEADRAIVAYTELPFAQENLTNMIVKLTAYSR